MARKRPAQRCSKTKRSGEQCSGYAVMGGTLCRAHLRPSPAAAAIVKEKLTELNAQSIAERAVWEPSPTDHQKLRTRTAMTGILRLHTLVSVYYDAAKAGDQHAAAMLVGYQRELTSLLKILPAGMEPAGTLTLDDALEKIVAVIDGEVSPPPLRRVGPAGEITV